jgi:ATP adenylyltransferase
VTVGDLLQRLWAPHRMAYVTGEDPSAAADGDECPFCRLPTRPDDENLVVHRGATAYAMLNLHPYNPGHLMVLPYRHVADYESLNDQETAEIALLTQQALRTLRAVSQPHGFNVGLNLGGVAGGSLSSHLHQHVVPRWSGDANFITVVGETKLLPQLLGDTRELLATRWSLDVA